MEAESSKGPNEDKTVESNRSTRSAGSTSIPVEPYAFSARTFVDKGKEYGTASTILGQTDETSERKVEVDPTTSTRFSRRLEVDVPSSPNASPKEGYTRRGSDGSISAFLGKPKKQPTKKAASKGQTPSAKRCHTIGFKRKKEQAEVRRKAAIEELFRQHPDCDEAEANRWVDAFQVFDADSEDRITNLEVGVVLRALGGNFNNTSHATVLSTGKQLADGYSEDWDMNLTQFLQLAMDLSKRTTMEVRPNDRRFAPPPSYGPARKPFEYVRDTIMQLYDEGFFTHDAFYHRVNSGSKKEQPKEKEYNERGALMLLALQRRLHYLKSQVALYKTDIGTVFQVCASLTESRNKQMNELLKKKNEIREDNEAMQKRVVDEEQKLQEMDKKRNEMLLEWEEQTLKAWEEKEALLLQQRRLEIQMRSDRQAAAEFMARMLQKEYQLQGLKALIPQCNKLRLELAAVNEENEVICKLLSDCLKVLESSLPAKNQAAEQCRQKGMALECSLRVLLNKYRSICVDAETRVEDVLPYSKVARRPGGYHSRKSAYIPGDVRKVVQPNRKFQDAAQKILSMQGPLFALFQTGGASDEEVPTVPRVAFASPEPTSRESASSKH